MRKTFFEILDELAPHDQEDQIIMLQSNNTLPLRQVLVATFDPAIQFDVEIPVYPKNKEVDGYASNSLWVEYRRLYLFMKEAKTTPKRKKEILGQILESIDPSDAIVLEQVIRKDFSKFNLTAETVNMAFPGLIKNLDKK